MPIVKLPDGTLVQLPDEEQGMLDKLASTGKKVGADLAAGFGQTANLIPKVAGMAMNLPSKLLTGLGNLTGLAPDMKLKVPGSEAGPAVEAVGDSGMQAWEQLGRESGFEPGYKKAITQGVGGSLAFPIVNAQQPVRSLLGMTVGGGAGGAGVEAGNKFLPENPLVAALLGGLAGGTGAFVAGPRQSVGKADIRRALNGLTPQDYQDAERNIQLFSNAGATTPTLAEAFPPGSGIMALANKVRGGYTDNALRLKTQGRPADLENLGFESMNRVAPPVDANAVANDTAGAANLFIQNLKGLRGDALGNRLQGDMLPPVGVRLIRNDLRKLAAAQDRPTARDAFEEVARALTSAKGGPIINTQEASFALKGLKDSAKNPNAVLSNGRAISGVDLSRAIQGAESGIGDLSPAFAQGMADFKRFSRGPVADAVQGPIGALADRNPLIAGQTPVAKLEGFVAGNSPQTVEGTARNLATPAFTGEQPANPLEIARALMQNRTQAGTTNPGAAIRGLEGSPKQQNLEALIRAGGGNPQAAMEPLAAADRLQPFSQPANMQEMPMMQLRQALLRPFRTADMMLTASSEKKVQHEIAQLLADPANLKKIQEIAMFNPNVRRALMAEGGILPFVVDQNKDGGK